MTVHDLSYRGWDGIPGGRQRIRWIISWAGIRLLLKKKLFLILLFIFLAPFFFAAVRIHLSSLFQDIPLLRIDAAFFRNFMLMENWFLFFIALFSGCGLIANDFRNRALQFYFAKPITTLDYLAGKFGVVGFFILLISFVPGEILFIMRLVYGGGDGFAAEYGWLPVSIALMSVIQLLVFGTAVLAISSLSRSGRMAGLVFAGIYLLPDVLRDVLKVILFRNVTLPPITMREHLETLAAALFRLGPERPLDTVISLTVLTLLVTAAGLVLNRRVTPEEVIR